MIAKEWRDARWKFFIAAFVVALLVPLLPPYEDFVEGLGDIPAKHLPGGTPQEYVMQEIMVFYMGGGFAILLPLAALLGAGLISGEVSNGTIWLLLSKPVSRIRLLLTKYAVSAGILLVAAILGNVLLIIAGAVRGYPLGQLSLPGMALSSLLLWLGMLFVLGIALLVSVIFRSAISSIIATALALYLILVALPAYSLELYYLLSGGPSLNQGSSVAERLIQGIGIAQYWFTENMFVGDSFAAVNFLVCMIAAAIPLLAALLLFNRKAY
jgi:ABC-type transport system involved in multi-copper enzyme maturation permease subunit